MTDRSSFRRRLWAGTLPFLLAASPAAADTLREALVKAYNTSPTLNAQRAAQRANDENVPIQRAAGLPSANATGGYTENFFGSGGADASLVTPPRQVTGQLQISVPIYSGGQVRNSVRAAETRVKAGFDTLRGSESDLFTAVVGAYMDVIRDEAIVSLNQQNVHVLEVNLQATQDRFQVGDLTRTDVAQSQARLAQARSQLQTAQSTLISSRENYVRVIGSPPADLQDPPALPGLPETPDSAVDVALKNNPSLLAAQKSADATRYDIAAAKGARMPKVSLTGGGNYYNYLGSYGAGTGVDPALIGPQSDFAGSAGVSLTLPLYQGGRPAAEVRQAQALRSQAIEQATDAERSVVANTRSAYAVWKSSQEVIASSQTAVSADKLSLEGVRAENSVGNRTILDILNAEQELLNSQVTLVTAQHDAYVAGFALIAAMGEAEARDLGLDGGALYDPLIHYKSVRHSLSDWRDGHEPAPAGTGTAGIAPQTATVTKPLDPELSTPADAAAPEGPISGPPAPTQPSK
jgi:outer membrane protein